MAKHVMVNTYQPQTQWENPHDFTITGDLSDRNINGRIIAQCIYREQVQKHATNDRIQNISDSLIRAMTINLEKVQTHCREKNLPAAIAELNLFGICRAALFAPNCLTIAERRAYDAQAKMQEIYIENKIIGLNREHAEVISQARSLKYEIEQLMTQILILQDGIEIPKRDKKKKIEEYNEQKTALKAKVVGCHWSLSNLKDEKPGHFDFKIVDGHHVEIEVKAIDTGDGIKEIRLERFVGQTEYSTLRAIDKALETRTDEMKLRGKLADKGLTLDELKSFLVNRQAEFLADKINRERKAYVEPVPVTCAAVDNDNDDDELRDAPELAEQVPDFQSKLAAPRKAGGFR